MNIYPRGTNSRAHARARPLEQRATPPFRTLEKGSLSRNVQRFRGGLVVKAHRLLYHHSTLGLREIKKKKKGVTTSCHRFIQGYLAHNKTPPPRTLR